MKPLAEPHSRGLLAAFRSAHADEGTLWLLDEAQTCLEPVWNSGPHAARIQSQHRQPLDRGLISLVCISEQPLCENEVYRHAAHDDTLDRVLGMLTCAMIAVPLRIAGAAAGVVSCVKLQPCAGADPHPAGFGAEDLRVLQSAADALGDALGEQPGWRR